MGCANSSQTIKRSSSFRDRYILAEEALVSTCKAFEFQSCRIADLDLAINQYANSSTLTEKQLRQGLASCGLQKSLGQSSEKLLKAFRTCDCSYYVCHIGALGALLGSGTVRNRAILVFNNYDQQCRGEFDFEDFKDYLKLVVQLEFSVLPGLAIDLYPAEEDEICLYAQYMKRKFNKLAAMEISLWCSRFGDAITKSQFKAELKREDFRSLFDLKALREALLQF